MLMIYSPESLIANGLPPSAYDLVFHVSPFTGREWVGHIELCILFLHELEFSF